MALRTFSKKALTIPEQISFLKAKGLIINDVPGAERCLAFIGYYRLKIYMRSFEDASKKFKAGSTFESVIKNYNFDRELRLLCMDAIERIEVALRSNLINTMAIIGGPHFYYSEEYFEKREAVNRTRHIGQSATHLSISHYRENYYDPHLPPIWCLTEASTFGQMSRLYADLGLEYRKSIAKSFTLDESICVSWFRSITFLRNICAHHSRLWNKELLVDTPKFAKLYRQDLKDNTRCYARLVICIVLLKNIDNGTSGWLPRLKELIQSRPPSIDLMLMGFPADWETRSIWQ